MKKYFVLLAMSALALVSCSKEFSPEAPETIQLCKEGISFVVEATTTKVTVDTAGTVSQMNWQAGDQITVWHNGKTYTFATEESGRKVNFYAVGTENVITTVDSNKPIGAYYNVTSVAANGIAKFAISAEQTEGTASNKVSLYAYSAKASPTDGVQALTFKPLVSVLEFNIKASSKYYDGTLKAAFDDIDYKLTKVVLTPKTGISGYTTFTSATVNPTSGTINPTGTAAEALTYNFADTTNIKDGRNIQFIIGACSMENTGATMDWYKGETKNYTKDIWASKTIDFTTSRIHFYQPLKTKEFGYGDYTGYYNRFYGCRSNQAKFIEYCNDEGALVLSNDIQMVGGNGNRIVTFSGLTWPFDGRGHYLFDVEVTDESTNKPYAFFTELKADVRNLNFGKPGRAKNSVTLSVTAADTRLAPITTIASSANVKIENCKNYVSYTLTSSATANVAQASGLIGLINNGAVVTVENCENHGNISVNITGESSKNCFVGGFVGQSNAGVTIKNSKNYGNISLEGTYKNNGTVAGFVPYTASSSPTCVDGCENYGTITNHNTYTTVSTTQVWAGGVMGRMVNPASGVETSTIKNCTNYGQVNIISDVAHTNSVKGASIVMDLQNNNASNNTARAGISVLSGDGKGTACWYTTWIGSGSFTGGSVLAGIEINGTAVDASNYTKKNFATSKNPTDQIGGVAMKDMLILLSE